MKVENVVCLWEWDTDKKAWLFRESFCVDSDGHTVTKSKLTRNERHAHLGWTSKQGDEIPGRLVTGWSMQSGVYLASFTAPSKYPDWMGHSWRDEILESKRWFVLIDGGWDMLKRTAQEAERFLNK